ncbi:TetR/AcrR family transcriptional regulator [uncultured Amnibacterium sp.]|uniref:TetR/AcrR family transcriptional regulator n=1 Tax=uncultured Amnibacterium sp. TaxID=1631851 RepID=UPI0035CB41A4
MRIVGHAVRVFAVAGYHATPVADVATAAQVSPAYVFRLFTGKLGLFTAAVDHCFAQVAEALVAGGESAGETDAAGRLDAMTAAYVELIGDRDLIMLQAHAQSAADVPEVREAVQRGLALVVRTVRRVSGAPEADVQRFIAYGQLCHLIAQTGLDDLDTDWAALLTRGISHPVPR